MKTILKTWTILCAAVCCVVFGLAAAKAQCPTCPGPACPVQPTVVPSVAANYNAFHAAILSGKSGILYVGVAARPEYFSCSVPAGFGGLATGAYHCQLTRQGPMAFPVLNTTTCDCCKPSCTCKPGAKNPDCVCYPCKCN